MNLREFINRLSFVVVAQNLVVPFCLPVFLENPTGKERKKKKFKPQDQSLPSGKYGKCIYHRRLGREYENYKKD